MLLPRIHSYVFPCTEYCCRRSRCYSLYPKPSAKTQPNYIYILDIPNQTNSIGIILLFCRLILFVLWFSHSVFVQILFRQRWLHNGCSDLFEKIQTCVLCDTDSFFFKTEIATERSEHKRKKPLPKCFSNHFRANHALVSLVSWNWNRVQCVRTIFLLFIFIVLFYLVFFVYVIIAVKL